MSSKDTNRPAALIDAENNEAKHAAEIFEDLAALGEVSIRRIYGDFSAGSPQGWNKEILARYAIVPQQQFANTTGKNASDIALVIDATDILHQDKCTGFVLISSDSDFTRLASQLREEGLDVFGIGLRKTPEAFVNACKRFIYIENIGKRLLDENDGRKTDKAQNKHNLNHAYQLIRNVVQNTGEFDGWASLSFVGSELDRQYPDFDSRTYGHKRLSDLVRAIRRFEETGANETFRIRCRDERGS